MLVQVEEGGVRTPSLFARALDAQRLQGYLTHKEAPPPLGPGRLNASRPGVQLDLKLWASELADVNRCLDLAMARVLQVFEVL